MNWTRHDTRALIEAAEERPSMSIGMVKAIRRHFLEDGLVGRMARFERFVGETDATPHVWGVSDCSLMVADWCVVNGYRDPAADLRGRYDTEQRCRELLETRGGLSQVVAACARASNLSPLHEPEFGCVAVIGAVDRPERQWSAIWNGHKWMVRWLAVGGRPMWAPFAAKPLGIWRV